MYETNPKRQNAARVKSAILFGYKGVKPYLYVECEPVVFRPPPVPEDDNRLTTMKKYLLLLLLGTFLCACSSDDGEGIPFVTDVVMPSGARTFAPGDEVTVSAKGFEAGDDIMLRIAWPLTNAALSDGYVMLSVKNAEGCYTPMVFGRRSAGTEARLGDPVYADGMIPFWIVESASDAAGPKHSVCCGYAVVKDGATELRLYDPAAMTFGEVLAAVPAAVRSVTAVTFPDSDIQDRIYMLCDLGDGGSRVQVYDRAAKSLDIFSGTVYCTEIVLVR